MEPFILKAFCNLWILALFLVYNKYLWHERLNPEILILKLSHVKNASSAIANINRLSVVVCTQVYLVLGRVGEFVLKIVFKSLVSRTQSGDHDLEIYKPFIYLVLLLIYLWITLFWPIRMFFWPIRMFIEVNSLVRWPLSQKQVPFAFLVKYATWTISYDKSTAESKNRCSQSWKCSHDVIMTSFVKNDIKITSYRRHNFIFRLWNINFWIPRSISHKKYLSSHTLPEKRTELR